MSASTADVVFNSAQDFAYVADKNGFESEAKLMNYDVKETSSFVKEAFSIPGIGTSKRLVEFAFENNLNSVSEVYKVSLGYVVAKVSEVLTEGVKPFEDVKKTIEPLVIKEKKFVKVRDYADKIKKQIGDDLFKAKSIDSKLIVDSTGQFSPNGTIPKIGRDYAFLNGATHAELNKVTDPVKGNRGDYLIKVTEKSAFDSVAYSIQRNSIKEMLLQEKRSAFVSQWLEMLKKDANIVDRRYMFFGR
jgi:hypothetical protein